MNTTIRGVLLFISSTVLYAGIELTGKAVAGYAPMLLTSFFRYLFFLICTLAYFFMVSETRALIRTPQKPLLVLRGIALGTFGAFSFTAMMYLPISINAAVVFSAPIAVTVLSRIFLRESVSVLQWCITAAGFIGVLLLLRPESGATQIGLCFSAGAMLCLAVFHVLSRLLSAGCIHPIPPLVQLVYCAAGATAAAALTLPLAENINLRELPALYTSSTVCMGFMAFLGNYLMLKAYTLANASTLAPYTYTQIAVTVCGGIILFGDRHSLLAWFGMAIIITAGIVQTITAGRTAPTR